MQTFTDESDVLVKLAEKHPSTQSRDGLQMTT
jgi:hypothetical protein